MRLEDFLKENKIKEEKEIAYPIKKQKICEDYVMLYLEEEKIQLSVESYFQYGIKNAKGLSEELYEKLKDEERLFKAYRSCLRKLSLKDHTVKQIKDHLKTKQLNKEESDAIIEKLKSYGLLNDEQYCKAMIAHYEDSRLSNRQIKLKLMQSGISEQLITKHLKADAKAEFQKALALAKRYNTSIKNKSLNAKKQAILSKIVAAGFSYDTAMNAVQSIQIQGQNELELLRKEVNKAITKYSRKYEGRDLESHVITSLMQKGFDYTDIRKAMEEENG